MSAAAIALETIRVEHVMGMPIVVDVRDGPATSRLLDEVFAWLRHVEAVFSTFRADSEISRLNAGTIGLDEVEPDVRVVLTRCEELREETAGYFDARAAGGARLDPAGLVKGWAVERAASLLERGACLPVVGKRKGLEAIGRGIHQPILKRGAEETGPYLV